MAVQRLVYSFQKSCLCLVSLVLFYLKLNEYFLSNEIPFTELQLHYIKPASDPPETPAPRAHRRNPDSAFPKLRWNTLLLYPTPADVWRAGRLFREQISKGRQGFLVIFIFSFGSENVSRGEFTIPLSFHLFLKCPFAIFTQRKMYGQFIFNIT